MSICKSCPKKLLAIEGRVGREEGRNFKQLPCAPKVKPAAGDGWDMGVERPRSCRGRSSSKSKRQRKLLNEIFALKFCQVSCARLPPMRTSWLRSASRSSSSRGSGLPQHTHTQSHAHSRTSVLSRSLVTDSNSRAGAGKYH